MVGSKNDPLAIRHISWRPVGLAVTCYLACIASIGIRYKNFHIGGSYQVFCQQFFIFFYLSSVFGREARQMIFLPSGLNQAPPS